MEALLHRDQCYSLGQPWTTFAQGDYTLRKKRIHLGRRARSHRATCVQSSAGFGRSTVKIKEEEDEAEPPSTGGTKKVVKLPGTVQSKSLPKDNKVVFVAGATGKVGSRTVRELLKLGFQVRAGTRSVEKAEALFEDILQEADIQPQETSPFALFSPAKLFGFLKPKPGKQFDIVECDLEDAESIEPALGNAGVVVCCIGASEKEVLDVTGPYRIDFKATKNLIDAASAAQVDHFVLLTSLGTQKIGFPAAVLNLFWGVLIWKAKAEKALIECGIPYTIVRPGGMERPTDSYKETHNLVLSEADTLFGGQVSNLQIAELIACIVENLDVSRNKIVEAIAETTAPLRPIEELLEEISSIEQKVPAAPAKGKNSPAIAKAKPEVKAAKGRGTQIFKEERREIDEEEQRKLEALREKYEAEIEAAKEKENAALAEKAELQRQADEIRAKAEAAALAASQAKALEAAILAAAKKGNLLSEEEKQKIMDSVKTERQQKVSSSNESKALSKKAITLPFFKMPTIGVETTATDSEPSEPALGKEDDKSSQAKGETIAEKKRIEGTKKQEEEKVAQQEEREKAEKEAAELKKEEARKLAEAKRKEEAAAAKKREEAAAAKKKEEEEAAAAAITAKKKEEEEGAAAAAAAKKKKKEEEEEAEKQAKLVAAKDTVKEKDENQSEEDTQKNQKITESVSREKEALEKAKSAQTFRWPWQKQEAEEEEEKLETVAEEKQEITIPVEPVSSSSSSEQSVSVVAAKDSIPSPSSTPLSPYTMFPGLKPPSPPTSSSGASEAKIEKVVEPVQLTEQKKETVTEEIKSGSTEDRESKKLSAQETAAREQEALAKAKAATSFVWPWQKSSPLKEEEEEDAPSTVNITTEIPARSEAPPSPEPSIPVQSVDVEELKKTETLPRSSTLSPYTGFPDLKPPSPPTPSRSEYAAPPPPAAQPKSEYAAEQTAVSVEKTEVKKASPVGKSEQIKETVTEKASSKIVPDKESITESTEDKELRKLLVEEVAAREREALAKARAATSFTWPWQKPDVEQAEQTPPQPTEKNDPDKLQASLTPLSPYTQFPDFKPPIPPKPSPPVPSSAAAGTKLTDKKETLPSSSTPLSPFTGFPELKPPVPPRPSLPVQSSAAPAAASNKEETLPRSSTPLSPYTGFPDLKPPTTPAPSKNSENGAFAEVDKEPVGFKWPWQ